MIIAHRACYSWAFVGFFFIWPCLLLLLSVFQIYFRCSCLMDSGFCTVGHFLTLQGRFRQILPAVLFTASGRFAGAHRASTTIVRFQLEASAGPRDSRQRFLKMDIKSDCFAMCIFLYFKRWLSLDHVFATQVANISPKPQWQFSNDQIFLFCLKQKLKW